MGFGPGEWKEKDGRRDWVDLCSERALSLHLSRRREGRGLAGEAGD